jgi:predicted Zn-dependent protease
MEQKEKMYNEAFSFKNAGNIDEAISAFKNIQKKYGEEKVATNMIASLYFYEKEDAKSAIPFAKKGIKLSPKSEMASLCLVHSLFELHKHNEVEKEIKRYLSLGIKIKNYKILLEENGLTVDDFIK